MRLLALLALVASWPAFAQVTSATVPVTKVVVGRNCEDRTVRWQQSGAAPDTYTVEWLPVFNQGTSVQFDTPLRFSVPGNTLQWRGRVNRSGLFVVRVRGEYRDNNQPATTAWAESTAAAATSNAAFLFALSVCPPGGFTPN